MLLRSRPDGSVSADRVAGLLPSAVGGWLPPQQEEWPQEELLQEAEPDAAAPVARSWDGARHVPAEQRWRLDPGRGGVAALLVVAVLAAVLAAGVVQRGRPQEVTVPVVEVTGVPLPGSAASPATGAAVEVAVGGEVVVSVAGLVRSPGLVRLPAGSRVDDAVRAAGGPVDPAATGLLNLARVLVDGEQVLVGVEPPAAAAGQPGSTTAGGLVDLNAASVADLDGLPGIGPVLAQRIVDWRADNGRFASVDQLREVSGIGESTYEDLRERVVV